MAAFSASDPAFLVERLRKLLGEIDNPPDAPWRGEFLAWKDEVRFALRHAYGEASEELARFSAIDFGSNANTTALAKPIFQDGLQHARIFLAARVEDLMLRETANIPVRSAKLKPAVHSQRKVFLVHGHNHGMKETVARFLTKLGLDPVILHEQNDQGQTIIEKFEQHADVPFAVALFSNDDLGISHSQIKSAGATPLQSLLRPRARQNVVFECGYFIGRLGRQRVVLLHEDGVEMMSDYSGVIYVSFDAGDGWRTKLFRELKAAGFEVDANKMF